MFCFPYVALTHFLSNRKNIKTVINLQQSGEHASCGHGNDRKTGFSYNPQKLMEMESEKSAVMLLAVVFIIIIWFSDCLVSCYVCGEVYE